MKYPDPNAEEEESNNRPGGWDQLNSADVSTAQRVVLEQIADNARSELQAVAYGNAAVYGTDILPGLRALDLDALLEEYRAK